MQRGSIHIVTLGVLMMGPAVCRDWQACADTSAAKADVEAVVAGNNEFAFELYARLKDDAQVRNARGNLFFSPYSISTALAMTYTGARGETAEQMAGALRFPMGSVSDLAAAFGALQQGLKGNVQDKGYELNVANALWLQKDYGFLDSFLEINRRCFGAGAHEVDFVGATEETRKTINAWVERETRDKIKELLKRGDIDRATTLVLTNAIYFKGEWAIKFKETDTKDAPFHVDEDTTVQVPLMSRKGLFRYGADDEAETLVLPYKGKELSMVVVLPRKGRMGEVERGLTSTSLEARLKGAREWEVEVYLPKFKMTTGAIDVGKILQEMGMKDAFSRRADFSGMTGREDLWVSAVAHKAFVEVNEEGTEAAAATGVIMRGTAVVQIPVFRADRPFVFMIRDNRSGSILFIGRVMNPVGEE